MNGLSLLLCSLSLASAYWNTASVLQPPSTQFVALLNPPSYDNTTCAGRCCKRVEVSQAPDAACIADWKTCARLSPESIKPPCGAGVSFPCTAWVPCDRLAWPEGVLVLFILTVVALFLPCVKCMCVQANDIELFRKKAAFDGLFIFVLIILGAFYASAIVVASDYEHFAEVTETSLEFVSYQSCVDYCNHFIPWDTDNYDLRLETYQMFYCRDAKYDLTGFNIFPADRNQRPGSSECPTSWNIWSRNSFYGWYCSSCFERRGEWTYLRDLSRFNRIRGFVFWTVLLVVAFMNILLDAFTLLRWHKPCVWVVWAVIGLVVISGLGHFCCFITDCVYTHELTTRPGPRWTSSAVNRFDAVGFCASSIFVDFVGLGLMMALFANSEEVNGWLKQNPEMEIYDKLYDADKGIYVNRNPKWKNTRIEPSHAFKKWRAQGLVGV